MHKRYAVALFLLLTWLIRPLGQFSPMTIVKAAGEPILASLTVSPASIPPNATLSLTLAVTDPKGAGNIDRIWLGFNNCGVNPGEAYNSAFERNLANYFGMVIFNGAAGFNYQLAQVNSGAGCTGGTFGTSPWGSVIPAINAPGTVELVSVKRAISGNTVTMSVNLLLKNHPAGAFPIYYMARNLQGLYQNGTGGGSWTRSTYSLVVSAPPTPTPSPNDPPAIQSVTLSPDSIQPDGSLTIQAVFSDPQGAGDIQRVYIGLAPCTGSSYVMEMSYFEHNLANFIGLLGNSPGFGSTVWVARGNLHGECSSTRDTLTVWGVTSPYENSFGSAILQTTSFSQSGKNLTLRAQLQLNGFPNGVYSLYAAVMDVRGVYQNNQANGVWLKMPAQLTVSGSSAVLARINAYRALANLPLVTTNGVWETGNLLHGRYSVKNDVLSHQETIGKPYYSIEGASAAQSSILIGTARAGLTDQAALNAWMSGPFHALQILDPGLAQVGYGAYRENDGYYQPDGREGVQAAAGLDTYRGLNPFAAFTFPIFYPADGKVIPVNAYLGGEVPDPLAPCQGYSTPSGPPVVIQFGGGVTPVALGAYSFKQGSTLLPACAYTESSYTNPDLSAQSQARSILGGHDAIVLLPKDPLLKNTSYSISLTVNGKTYAWSFRVAADAGSTVNMPFLGPVFVR